MPPTRPTIPEYPFQLVSADHFTLAGQKYLVIVDRFSGWPVVEHCGDTVGAATGLLRTLRSYFGTFGVPEEPAIDGGTVFTSAVVSDFLQRFDVRHRVSSPHNPHSNQRAEVGVKSMKRLCRENVGRNGSLDSDRILRGLLAYRNTPDYDTGKSPAMVLFGRPLRGFLPVVVDKLAPCDNWRRLRVDRELALAKRAVLSGENLGAPARQLGPLGLGDTVCLQNLVGPFPKRWDCMGEIVEICSFNKYSVKDHGSVRLLVRNQQILRRIVPYGLGRSKIRAGTEP